MSHRQQPASKASRPVIVECRVDSLDKPTCSSASLPLTVLTPPPQCLRVLPGRPICWSFTRTLTRASEMPSFQHPGKVSSHHTPATLKTLPFTPPQKTLLGYHHLAVIIRFFPASPPPPFLQLAHEIASRKICVIKANHTRLSVVFHHQGAQNYKVLNPLSPGLEVRPRRHTDRTHGPCLCPCGSDGDGGGDGMTN